MKKIPFDIKYRPEIESGKYKVVTENELPARIICWDGPNDDKPIIAIAFDDQIEEYHLDGIYNDDGVKTNYDLFILTDEQEESTLGQMTDIELIKEKIEFIKNTDGVCKNYNETADVYYSRGVKFTCMQIIDIIDHIISKKKDKNEQ